MFIVFSNALLTILMCDLFHQVLSKMMVDTSLTERNFLNIQLSFRGAERQAPSVLSLALTFSEIMRSKADEGVHSSKLSTEERLQAVVNEFNSRQGVISKWHLDDTKTRAVLNMLVGTTANTRAAIQRHLDFHRWRECSLSSDLPWSSRWLLGTWPRACKDSLRKLLTVTPEIQEAFLENHIAHFCQVTRRVKPSVRSKHRPSVNDWDRMVDYTCVIVALKDEALSFWEDDQTKQDAVVNSLDAAFMARQWVDVPNHHHVCEYIDQMHTPAVYKHQQLWYQKTTLSFYIFGQWLKLKPNTKPIMLWLLP